jgi:hypothetical protein
MHWSLVNLRAPWANLLIVAMNIDVTINAVYDSLEPELFLKRVYFLAEFVVLDLLLTYLINVVAELAIHLRILGFVDQSEDFKALP